MNKLSPELIDATPPVQACDVAEPWRERRPLQRELPQPQPFPLDALGPVMSDAAKKMVEVIQAPPAMCGQSLLAAASLAVQSQADALIDGRRYPLSEYFITVGATGERKSAVDSIALAPHRLFQEKLRLQHKTDLDSYAIAKSAYDKAKSEALNNSEGIQGKTDALRKLGQAPVEPPKPILITEEPTFEGLVKLLSAGLPSIGLFADEGGRFVGGHGMNDENQLKTAAGLCGLWDGKPMTRVRSGDGASSICGKRLSTHLMVQPPVAQMLLSSKLLQEQGLLSRCLVSWPQSTAGKRPYKEIDLSADPSIQQYSTAMTKILERPCPLAEGSHNELDPPALRLDAEAKQLWIEFHDHVEEGLADGKPFAPIRGLASKAAEHVMRLSGVLSKVSDPDSPVISYMYVESAIELVNHYLSEALRLFSSAAVDEELVRAQELLEWLRSRAKDHISLVEIYQYGPGHVRSQEPAKRLLSILFEHGEVRPCQQRVEFNGILRGGTWEVRHV